MEKMTMRKAVKISVNSYQKGERFYGYNLKQRVVEVYPKCENCYVETILRIARDVARSEYRCVDMRHGLYEKM